MNASADASNQLDLVLERAGLDSRAQYFVPVMFGIALGTCALGTALLMFATWRSARKLPGSQPDTSPGQEAPVTVGSSTSPDDVHVSTGSQDKQALKEAKGEQRTVSSARRLCQVLIVFSTTFGLCVGVTIAGVIDGSLTKETGLAWESYVLLLSCACAWMLVQACVVVLTLQPGRGYTPAAFAEAMLSGMFPFVADSFDTLKDVIFGGLCFKSTSTGLHVLGVLSWVYLYLFHLGLLGYVYGYFLTDLSSSHLSVFALSTIDLKARPASLSRTEKVLAALGKQLSPAKRHLLLVENVPQAGMAIIYLATEGGSLLVALLNLAIPAGQVFASVFLHKPLQRRLARWYAQRLDAALDDADAVLGRRMCREIVGGGPELMHRVAWHSAYLSKIYYAREQVLLRRGDIVVAGEPLLEGADELALELCCTCIKSAESEDFDGELDISGIDLQSQHEVLQALVNFAFFSAWVEKLWFYYCKLTGQDVEALSAAMSEASAHRRGPRRLSLTQNEFGDEGVFALARALPNLHLEELYMCDCNITNEGVSALARVLPQCRDLKGLYLYGNSFEDVARARQALESARPDITVSLSTKQRE
ncbi:Rnh1 [Symbiodinium sp. CCMP2456]|nr:Rnh1 [Symbiodinium sp. CCMP2456]